ncbi:MAG: hypothetical protein ACM3PY_07780 [Omnitrophica WOR_2 bacterium]
MSSFITGIAGGYQLGIRHGSITGVSDSESPQKQQAHVLSAQIQPEKGYQIPAKYGTTGPQLLKYGAIDYKKFEGVYAQAGKPLTDEQKTILQKGSDQEVIFTAQNAYFLLNFFWALGLTNQNAILTEGPMMQNGREQAGSFASTGGWTIGVRTPMQLFASTPILYLTSEQQGRLKEVASAVYRPCCDNPTHFPDCNHGMAILGLLELMASQDATEDQMFEAAKHVNGFWYPQQTLEIATLFQTLQNVDFNHADARQVVSAKYSSGSGFQAVHRWLASNNLLEQAPDQGGSCGVQ